MNIHKRKKTVVGSLAGLALIGSVAATGVAVANAANEKDSATSSQGETKIKGSIAVTESKSGESDAAEDARLAKLASIDQQEASAAALASVPGGSLVGTELDEEDGWLVYEVTVKDGSGVTTEVIVDAGNAKILASEIDDDSEEAIEGSEPAENPEQGTKVEENNPQEASPGATTAP